MHLRREFEDDPIAALRSYNQSMIDYLKTKRKAALTIVTEIMRF
jgi:hypothetical protein